MLFPVLLILGGGAALLALLVYDDDPVPHHEPDLPPGAPPPAGFPRSTGYRRIDAILPALKNAAETSGIPLGLIVGWIAKESGGKLEEVTKLDERGYFQSMPAEDAKIGRDHLRNSTDSGYSINSGLLLITEYARAVETLGVAARGSSFFWWLVKFMHSIGSGAATTIVKLARAAGQAGSLTALRRYALEHDDELYRQLKHRPSKWIGLTDKVMETGRLFGIGDSTEVLVGAAFPDISDPLDVL